MASMLDLRSSQEELASALEAIVAGDSVLDVRVGWRNRPLLRDIFAREDPRADLDLRMLELLALGLPDHEMGRRLHLSPHTVKHHVESLRWELGLRNRIELAAWAGRHGFYSHSSSRAAAHETGLVGAPAASSGRAT
jgi:DNA-binding NarL/FixJ family response regulator